MSASRSQRKRAHEDLNGNGGSSLGRSTLLGGRTLIIPPWQSWTSTSASCSQHKQAHEDLHGNGVKDVYTQRPLFFNLHQFAKRLRNMFGSCCHAPHAIFKKYTKLHNRGLHLGFIKDTDARMAGAHITLCRVLQLKNALRATINSPEFITLKQFKAEISILQSEDFWNYLFSMCRALYVPMHLLRLADQKVAAMDKMHFYVCQTDANMSYYLSKVVVDSGRCTHEENVDHPHKLRPRSDPLVVFQGSEAA